MHADEINSGELQLPDEIHYVPRNINGRKWLYYQSPVGLEKIAYPIDSKHFILVSIDCSFWVESTFKARATAMQDAILDSFQVVDSE